MIKRNLCIHPLVLCFPWQDINAAWKQLEGAEKAYEEFLNDELRR